MTFFSQDDSTQNQKNSLQNGETPAKVEIKEENAENKSVAETAETSPPTENGKNESGSAPDENGKENQVCKNSSDTLNITDQLKSIPCMDGYMIEWEAIHDLLTVRKNNGSYYRSND